MSGDIGALTIRVERLRSHDAADVVRLEALRQLLVPHVATDGVMDFRLLQMEARFRKFVEVPNVIVVHMGQDDVLDLRGIDVQQSQ